MPGEKQPEELAEEILNEADSDMNTDDLLRGTEVYEEEDGDVEESNEGELFLEPTDGSHAGFDAFDDGPYAEDAHESWD